MVVVEVLVLIVGAMVVVEVREEDDMGVAMGVPSLSTSSLPRTSAWLCASEDSDSCPMWLLPSELSGAGLTVRAAVDPLNSESGVISSSDSTLGPL